MKLVLTKLGTALGAGMRYLARRFKNLRVIIVLAMSVASLIAMVIFSGLVFGRIQEIISGTAVTNTQQVVNQTSATLDSYIDSMLRLAGTVNDRLQDASMTRDELKEFLDNSQTLGSDIVSIALFADNGKLAYYAPSDLSVKPGITLSTQSWYEEDAQAGVISFSTPHVHNLFRGSYDWVLSLYTHINIRGNEYLLVVDMNFSSINQYVSKVNIGRRGYAFLVDEDGRIIYHPQQQMIYAGIKEEDLAFLAGKDDGAYLYSGEDVVMVVSSLENVGWRTVGLSYMQDIRDTTNDIIGYMVIAYIAVLVVILVMAAGIARYISRPIGRIIKTMEGAQETGFTSYTREDNYDEVRRLSNSYNEMTGRIRELMDQIKREQRELRKTEIRALQAQINPHFLYNTLDSILWMCEKGDNEGAVVMVSALGSLFRISLSKGREIITVRQELQHAENYLRIQGVRYKDQFRYQLDIPAGLLDHRTPKIILQPFLENAIYHGFGHSTDPGLIRISAVREEDALVLRVEDDGVGMPPDLVERINAGEVVGSSGIGISNVNSRIQIYFGKEYGVRIHSEADQGTTVTIRLPMNITEDDILE